MLLLLWQLKVSEGLQRPGNVLEFDLGPGKLLEFAKSEIYSGIVLKKCKYSLKNIILSLKIIKMKKLHDFS